MYYGWILLTALSAIYFFSVGTIFYGFSVIVPEMIRDMGWSRSEASLGFSLFGMALGLSGPVAAYLIGQFNARTVMSTGGLLAATGAFAASYMNSLAYYYVLLCFIAFGLALLSVVPGLQLLANWFARKRSLAIGIFMSMGGAGAFFAAPAISALVQATGNWRHAWLVMAVAAFSGSVIALIFVRDKPEDKGTVIDGGVPLTTSGAAATAAVLSPKVHQTAVSWEVRDAIRSSSFWIIVAAAAAVVLGHGIVNSQGVLHLRDLGISPVVAASVIGMIGMLGAGGRLFTGILGDHIDPRYLLASGLTLELIGMVLLIFADTVVMAYVFAVIFGAGNGMAIVASPALVANYFGNKNYASLIGIRGVVITLSTASGPFLAGLTFDMSGSYTPVFLTFAAIAMIPVIVVLFMRPPEPKDPKGVPRLAVA
ncbi:MAG: MFS transporter [Pseudomonadota bacterium]|jgi:MFS family permease|nr:hypothetical protein [Alphaproteobacteria bacterium]